MSPLRALIRTMTPKPSTPILSLAPLATPLLCRPYSTTKPPSPSLKPQSITQIAQILAAMQQYPDGMQRGDVALTSKAFHADANMYGWFGGALLGGPISNLWEYIRGYGAATRVKTRIDVLAVTPTTAVVRVEMEGDNSEVDFTDFHTLVKVEDGSWKVVSKVFHAYDRK